MEKYVPIEKMSKKSKRELAKSRRGSWGGINPVTRKPDNPKAYNRKKARRVGDYPHDGPYHLAERKYSNTNLNYKSR